MVDIDFNLSTFILYINFTIIEKEKLLNKSTIFSTFKGENLEFKIIKNLNSTIGFETCNGKKCLTIPENIIKKLQKGKVLSGTYFIERRTCDKGFYEFTLI